MQRVQRVSKGCIVQANELANDWCGCLLIVSEVKSWGVQCYMKIPNEGTAFVRLENGAYEIVGVANLVVED